MSTFDFYFAGELFDAKHLMGNAYLAAEILEKSQGKYRPVLPQDLEQRSLHPHDIRDEDILTLLESDLALFHFDGSELDSGTVVEFMLAKFADIPAVVLRTDFRSSGDQIDDPWNLMVSFYPRTEVVLINSLATYKTTEVQCEKRDSTLKTDPQVAIERMQNLNTTISEKVISAFDKVTTSPPLLLGQQQETVLNWLQSMCGFNRNPDELKRIFDRLLERKRALTENN